jgi:hypothetical protein
VPSAAPIGTVDGGAVRGAVVPGRAAVYVFRGLPYAASPAGDLRWRPPRPPAPWPGVRDATRFGPSCPQLPNPALTGPASEDCLYLNVYTPTLDGSGEGGLPVLVWIHGGRFTLGAGRDYDGTKLTTDGTVVVTINFRLGVLGFLAHPALASMPGSELADVLPVRGGPAVIKQARRGQGEGTGAHRDHPGAAGSGLAQRRAHSLTRVIQRQVSRHHHCVRRRQRLQAMLSLDGNPAVDRTSPGTGAQTVNSYRRGRPGSADT